jgi:hypothetical protein
VFPWQIWHWLIFYSQGKLLIDNILAGVARPRSNPNSITPCTDLHPAQGVVGWRGVKECDGIGHIGSSPDSRCVRVRLSYIAVGREGDRYTRARARARTRSHARTQNRSHGKGTAHCEKDTRRRHSRCIRQDCAVTNGRIRVRVQVMGWRVEG